MTFRHLTQPPPEVPKRRTPEGVHFFLPINALYTADDLGFDRHRHTPCGQ
jgi:hypothetical protein